jgi:hypothetical protein
VSVAAPPPAGGRAPTAPPTPPSAPASSGEACPLCGAPLHHEQEWCLHCGAAARTRLAASPNWKGLTTTLAVLVALSLGVLAAALVKLAAGDSAPPATTRTITAAAATAPATSTGAPASGLPATTAPGASTGATVTTTTSPASTPTPTSTTTSTTTTTTGATDLAAPGSTTTSSTKAKREAQGTGLSKELEELRNRGKLPPGAKGG